MKTVRVKPTPAVFVGRWKLEAESLPSVEKRMGQQVTDSYLDLAADGRLAAVNMPVEDLFLKPRFQLLSLWSPLSRAMGEKEAIPSASTGRTTRRALSFMPWGTPTRPSAGSGGR